MESKKKRKRPNLRVAVHKVQNRKKSKSKRKTYYLYLLITFVFGCITAYPTALIPIFENQLNTITPSDISWLFAVRALGYCASTIFVGLQLDFFNNTHYFASITIFISLIPLIFMNIIQNFSIFICFWFIIGFATGTMQVSVPVYIWRLFATSASAKYTSTGITSGIGGTLMPLLIQLSLYQTGSYQYASYLLSLILLICSILLFIFETPRHSYVVKQMKEVKNKNMAMIRSLQQRQKTLNKLITQPTYSVGLMLNDDRSDLYKETKRESNEPFNPLKLLQKTFTEILISDTYDDEPDAAVNVFDIEENQNAAEYAMGGIFNPVLLQQMADANEDAGIDEIVNTPATPENRVHHEKLKTMLSAGVDNAEKTDVMNYDFGRWITPKLLGIPEMQDGDSNQSNPTPATADGMDYLQPLDTFRDRFRINVGHPASQLSLSINAVTPDAPAAIQDEPDTHWFGVERNISRFMNKIHEKGRSRRSVFGSQTIKNLQIELESNGDRRSSFTKSSTSKSSTTTRSLYRMDNIQQTRMDKSDIPQNLVIEIEPAKTEETINNNEETKSEQTKPVQDDGKTKETVKGDQDRKANWKAMKVGLTRVRYKQEIIILCVILMLFHYGWQTVLLANIVSYVDEDDVGRYMISVYSFSKYMSRFFLLIFHFPKNMSLEAVTFAHLLLLVITSLVFWNIGTLGVGDKNYIYLYCLFFGFGVFGACVKTAIFAICKKIQPISGFIASVFLLAKCLGDGILPWIVARTVDEYDDYAVYEWAIGYMPFIMLTAWLVIIVLFSRYLKSKKEHELQNKEIAGKSSAVQNAPISTQKPL